MKYPKVKWYWPRSIVSSLKKLEIGPKTSREENTNDERSQHEDDAQADEIEVSSETRSGEETVVEEVKDNSRIDLRKVYDDRLEAFLNPRRELEEKEEEEEARNSDDERDDHTEEEDELELRSRRNELKRREEINKNENESEALSEREEENDEEQDIQNEEVKKIIITK